jgi:hypothetical protein
LFGASFAVGTSDQKRALPCSWAKSPMSPPQCNDPGLLTTHLYRLS